MSYKRFGKEELAVHWYLFYLILVDLVVFSGEFVLMKSS